MRDYLNILESVSAWDKQTPEQLRGYARDCNGESTEGYGAETRYDWTFEPHYHLANLINDMAGGKLGWANWFSDELEMSTEEELHRDWERLAKEEIEEPIVVAYTPKGVEIWDGYHRTGASIAVGRTTIPAVVGRPRKIA